MSMQPQIQLIIDKFHRRMAKDEDARKKVEPITKTINLDLGEEKYSMKLDHAQIVDFKDSLYEDADIMITTTPENLTALMEGTLRPMKAYVTKKVLIKGKIQDLMFLKELF